MTWDCDRPDIDTVDVPLDNLPVGSTPHMNAQDVSDLECFLDTLTDGYDPKTTPTAPSCVN
jgi:cytochrome c peroxidase